MLLFQACPFRLWPSLMNIVALVLDSLAGYLYIWLEKVEPKRLAGKYFYHDLNFSLIAPIARFARSPLTQHYVVSIIHLYIYVCMQLTKKDHWSSDNLRHLQSSSCILNPDLIILWAATRQRFQYDLSRYLNVYLLKLL